MDGGAAGFSAQRSCRCGNGRTQAWRSLCQIARALNPKGLPAGIPKRGPPHRGHSAQRTPRGRRGPELGRERALGACVSCLGPACPAWGLRVPEAHALRWCWVWAWEDGGCRGREEEKDAELHPPLGAGPSLRALLLGPLANRGGGGRRKKRQLHRLLYKHQARAPEQLRPRWASLSARPDALPVSMREGGEHVGIWRLAHSLSFS